MKPKLPYTMRLKLLTKIYNISIYCFKSLFNLLSRNIISGYEANGIP